MSKKIHLTKTQVITGITVVVVIALAVGFGILVRMLQQNTTNGNGGTGATSQDEIAPKLPPIITEIQDLQSAGKTAEAEKKIEEGIASSSNDNSTKYMLYIQKGNLLTNNGNAQGGIAEYLKAFEVSETYEVTRLLGEMYQQVGNNAKAIEFYKRAIPLVPEDSPVSENDRQRLREIIRYLGGTV